MNKSNLLNKIKQNVTAVLSSPQKVEEIGDLKTYEQIVLIESENGSARKATQVFYVLAEGQELEKAFVLGEERKSSQPAEPKKRGFDKFIDLMLKVYASAEVDAAPFGIQRIDKAYEQTSDSETVTVVLKKDAEWAKVSLTMDKEEKIAPVVMLHADYSPPGSGLSMSSAQLTKILNLLG